MSLSTKELELLKEIFEKAGTYEEGDVATYIPELAEAPPSLYGMSICDLTGKIHKFGDSEIDFCLQSCCKPLSYALACEEIGGDKVHEHVGFEPSGVSFNAHVLNDRGLPHNPLINSGAMMVASLIHPKKEPAERYKSLLKFFSDMGGKNTVGHVGYNNTVFLSEKQHADRNMSLAYEMRGTKAFNGNPDHGEILKHLDLYFQACSITINAQVGSVMAATLANGGVCPITRERVIEKNVVRDTLALMYTCGMYDYSGQFSFRVGLPAKSGVSGCILLVVPNRFGICIYSPKLNKEGNSVKGLAVCEMIGRDMNEHIFHNIVSKTEFTSKDDKSVKVARLIAASANGDIETLEKLNGIVDYGESDYDGRTALHLAAANKRTEVIRYLLSKGVKKDPVDNMGYTPYNEAEKHLEEDDGQQIADMLIPDDKSNPET